MNPIDTWGQVIDSHTRYGLLERVRGHKGAIHYVFVTYKIASIYYI